MFTCPAHGYLLNLNDEKNGLNCDNGCYFPIVNNIPRFVPQGNYVTSFGLQWNEYRTTQSDSHTGLTISRDRHTRLVGGSLDIVKGKNVREAGCGAGRFSELLFEAGAHLHAVDLSSAVEANSANCHHFPNYSVCQASILELPFAPAQFDIAICIGVIQHTPGPEETMSALCRLMKPGGMPVMDHYTYGYETTWSRAVLRAVLLKLSSRFSLWFCRAMATLLWPIHRLLWRGKGFPFVPFCEQFF